MATKIQRMTTMIFRLDPCGFIKKGKGIIEYDQLIKDLLANMEATEEEMLVMLQKCDSNVPGWMATVLYAQVGTI